MSRTWKMWGTRRESGEIWYVGTQFFNKMHYSNDPTVKVLVTETTMEDATHFGWEYTDRPGAITMIFPKAKKNNPMMLLDMCFPYGLKAAVDSNEGKPVPLHIKIVESHDED